MPEHARNAKQLLEEVLMLTIGPARERFSALVAAIKTTNSFCRMLPMKMCITALEILIIPDMASIVQTQIATRAIEAMHWIICPYTVDDAGIWMKISDLEDAPHIIELAESYNELIDWFCIIGYNRIEFC
jgi:hypothetical protein